VLRRLILRKQYLFAALLLGTIGAALTFSSALKAFQIRFDVFIWALSIVAAGFHFFRQRIPGKKILNGKDGIMMVLLCGIFTPLYLGFISLIPFTVCSDEIVIWNVVETCLSNGNVLGLSHYFWHPNFVFMFLGTLGKLLGGVDFVHMRMVGAFLGMGIILFSYLFFRTSFPVFWAFSGAVLIGCHHALLGISRMILWANTGLFNALIAFNFLLIGLRRKDPFFTYVGGVFVGLSVYLYLSGRVISVVWVLFITVGTWFFKGLFSVFIRRLSAPFLIGVILTASPLVLTTLRTPDATYWTRHALLFLKEGRETQQSWVNAPTVSAGLWRNIRNGLTLFNNREGDYEYIYENAGLNIGFFDPVSGVLVWIGLIAVLWRRCRWPGRLESNCLACVGLFFLWFAFTFLVNKTPGYTRVCMLLPFAVYFVLQALMLLLRVLQRTLRWKRLRLPATWRRLGPAVVVVGIGLLNLSYFEQVMMYTAERGHPIGGTARYVARRTGYGAYHFYLAEARDDRRYPYYGWGEPGGWRLWIKYFANPSHHVEVIPPAQILSVQKDRPFSVFMNHMLWAETMQIWTALYSHLRIFNIKPDGSLVAVEVL
jgi:hypothetical protein